MRECVCVGAWVGALPLGSPPGKDGASDSRVWPVARRTPTTIPPSASASPSPSVPVDRLYTEYIHSIAF